MPKKKQDMKKKQQEVKDKYVCAGDDWAIFNTELVSVSVLFVTFVVVAVIGVTHAPQALIKN